MRACLYYCPMYYSLLEVSESSYVVQIREKNGRKIALGNDFMLAPTAAPSCRCRTKIQLSPGKVNKYRVGESFEQLLKVTMKPESALDPHIILCTVLIRLRQIFTWHLTTPS